MSKSLSLLSDIVTQRKRTSGCAVETWPAAYLTVRRHSGNVEAVIELLDGNKIPDIGFGTYPLRGEQGAKQVGTALEIGYRLIDSAFNYDNEAAVGRALRKSGIPREELFVTSKLPGRYHQRPAADDAIRESLWRLGLDYMDLYLIHWPNPIQDHYVEAWGALVDAQKAGLVRSIGVSNFTTAHIQRIEQEVGVLPTVNQVELHPYFPQTELVADMDAQGIRVEAWSPLGRGSRPYEEPVIVRIAGAHGVTPAQVVLRWHLQRGIIPIPKSSSVQRQRENFEVFGFELSGDEVRAITALGREDGRWFDGDPNVHEEM